MARTIEVELPYGSLICDCGNREDWDYADKAGNLVEKSDLWRGFYRCGRCGLVAHWPSGRVVVPESDQGNEVDSADD